MPMLKNWRGNKIDLNSKGLPQPQKNAVIILAAVAVFIVVFWIWQMRAHINQPFNYKLASSGADTSQEDYDKLLKNTDTDHDGLSDYEEIYTYKTSPYLDDTDSDGLSDKKEIDNGTDPACPQGKDCSAAINTSSASANSSAAGETTAATNLNSTSADETALQNALNGTSDAATLRQLLISSGASAEELNQISDADLMKSYQETLQSQNQE